MVNLFGFVIIEGSIVMKTIMLPIVAAMVLAVSANAEELDRNVFDAKGYVASLNMILDYGTSGELTNSDVAKIASTGCATLRKIRVENLIEKTSNWIERKGYPSPKTINEIDFKEFVSFELNAFAESGASERTLGFIDATLSARDMLPTEMRLVSSDVLSESNAEKRFCEANVLSDQGPNAPATEDQIVLTGAVADALTGAAIITVDVYTDIQTGGVSGGVFAVISGNIGWERLKRGLEK